MGLNLSMTGNGYLVPAAGYPTRLWIGGNTEVEGVIYKLAETVTATFTIESGSVDAHAAIYAMPTTAGGSPGAVITDLDTQGVAIKTYQTDLTGANGSDEQTVALELPTTKSPMPYVFRFWIDNITGQATETLDRDNDTLVTDEPALPTGISLVSVIVA